VNKQPIETARDSDLRLSAQALRRAAQRARELAIQTGTSLVVSHDGVIRHIQPQPEPTSPRVQDLPATYGDKP
jgi:hypothetical protein